MFFLFVCKGTKNYQNKAKKKMLFLSIFIIYSLPSSSKAITIGDTDKNTYQKSKLNWPSPKRL